MENRELFGAVSLEGSRRVGGVVSLTELSRDRGHKRGAWYRKSTILGRGIKDLSSRPQRQRAARCSAVRYGEVQRGCELIFRRSSPVEMRCGAARLWVTARDDGVQSSWGVGLVGNHGSFG